MAEFRWNAWNVEHISKHGVSPSEAEQVVRRPSRGFPRRGPEGKVVVWGQTTSGRYLQVIHVFDPPGVVYVIHARPLTDSEKHALRRRRRT